MLAPPASASDAGDQGNEASYWAKGLALRASWRPVRAVSLSGAFPGVVPASVVAGVCLRRLDLAPRKALLSVADDLGELGLELGFRG